jgi:hypothetical protein
MSSIRTRQQLIVIFLQFHLLIGRISGTGAMVSTESRQIYQPPWLSLQTSKSMDTYGAVAERHRIESLHLILLSLTEIFRA